MADPTTPTAAGQPEAPPSRQRGADPNRTANHLARMYAEQAQELGAAHALIDELEHALAAEMATSAALRTELVTATSGESAAAKAAAKPGR
jgi:hypothetical protein